MEVVRSKPVCGFEVFFGEIIATFMDSDCYTDGEPDPSKIAPLLGMGGEYFALGAPAGRVFQAGRELVKTFGPKSPDVSARKD